MTFPDQSHINRVRDALYQRSGNGASVMVGSGFSRNAERIILNLNEMPTWRVLSDLLNDALYPQDDPSQHGNTPMPALDNMTVAQEYEIAFGRTNLHDVLRRLVPDNGYGPGDAHRRLLKLPWRDIYSTNWDTLLERSRDQVPDHRYSVVTSVEEIPMAGRPRIVKLHGSFPAQFPLIVTEEDYRTYPTKFAPFVNTVQQAMMETVFLLIGFSGDDPNFLNWSGWVRDNLGASAPRIYLAGWLGLSHHRRRMLESRNVVPIDLAQHPKAGDWPENLRPNYATEWLLRTLEEGRPYDITSWPTTSNRPLDEIPYYLQPIETASRKEPRSERATQGGEPESSPDGVRGITSIWRQNRLMYPGWMTMPPFNRQTMEQDTSAWRDQLLTALPTMKPVERLSFVRELAWREEILLLQMTPDLQTAIQKALDSINCHNRTIDSAAASSEDWIAIREDWRNAAATLVTSARFQFDHKGFEQAVEALEPFQKEDPDLRHRIIHEKCLWAVYDRDFNLLADLLADWRPENCDPAWLMRKSAMLWEAGRNAEAKELLNNSIAAIKAMPPDDVSLASLSRESWATLVSLDLDNRLTLLDRLKELVPMRCDAFGERQSVTDGMGQGKAEDDPPPFDINRMPGTHERWVNYNPNAAAYRAVRLSEIAGIPPFTERATVWAEVLRIAAEEVADYNMEFAARLVMRACSGDNDQTLGRILTRTRVATMSANLAETLAQCCLNALDKAMRDIVTPVSATQQRFNTAAEVLSRLVIRLEPDHAESLLNQAMDYCQNPELAKSFVNRTVTNLLMRSWEALPAERRQDRAMDLLSTEIAGLNTIEPTFEYGWPDPAEVISFSDTKLIRTPENEPQWQDTIDLVVRGLTSNPAARRRASHRMVLLVQSNLLTEGESLRIAHALWSEQHTTPDGLPQSTNLYDWGFLTFPEPTLGLAEQRFRTKWLSQKENQSYEIQRNVRGFHIRVDSPNGLSHDPEDVESRLWHAGAAIQSLQRQERNLTLTQADQEHLGRMLESWAEDPVQQQNDFAWSAMLGDSIQQLTRHVAEALPSIMGEINVPQPLADKIYTKMQQLTANQLPAFALAVGLVRINPERSAEIATELRVGVTSDDHQLARNAVSAMHQWIVAASEPESKVPQPPDDLVREIGFAIASRRNTVIIPALQLATWIFENGQSSHKKTIQNLVEAGLRYLAQELRYDRENENPHEVPSKRLYCAELAAAMAKSKMDENPIVPRWLEMAREDPLPEVRQAIEEHSPD